MIKQITGEYVNEIHDCIEILKDEVLEKDINEAGDLLCDHFKGMLEQLICNNDLHPSCLESEARFMNTLSYLKFLLWEKYRRSNNRKRKALKEIA